MSRHPKLRSTGIVAAFAAVLMLSLVPTAAVASRVGAPAAHRSTRAGGRGRFLEAVQGHERQPWTVRRAQASS